MADKTGIEWTDATWTPIRARNKATGKVGWHCEHASPGCINCYSETFNEKRLGTGLPFKPGHRSDVEHFLDEAMLTQPLRWRKPRMVFVCSMTDLFGDWVSDEVIDRVFAVMALAPQHTFQVLTKRAERLRDYLTHPRTPGRIAREILDMWIAGDKHAREAMAGDRWPVQSIGDIDDPDDVTIALPLPNVWLGVSAEDQRRWDERTAFLGETPAAVRWVSAEPLLGRIYPDFDLAFIDWIVVGGESGKGARAMHPDWVRVIRDQCATAGVAFLFKQWGEWVPAETPASETQEDEELRGLGDMLGCQYLRRVGKKAAGRTLDGVTHDAFPHAGEVPFG